MFLGSFLQRIRQGHLQLHMTPGYCQCCCLMRCKWHFGTLSWRPGPLWCPFLVSYGNLPLFSLAILFPDLRFSVKIIEVIQLILIFLFKFCSFMAPASFYSQKILTTIVFSSCPHSSSHGIDSISSGPSFSSLVLSSHCSISPQGPGGPTT